MLTPEQTIEATDAALLFISLNPSASEQDLRNFVQRFLCANPYEMWGEATEIILQQSVRDARLAAGKNATVQAALDADRQMFLDSIATGANIDNPWVTNDDPERIKALALRVKVITLSNGG